MPSPKKPSADAIWVGLYDLLTGEKSEIYFRTRYACKNYLLELLKSKSKNPKARIMVGYDLDFGFPAGFATAMRMEEGLPWKSYWSFLSKNIHDHEDNRNNRFDIANKMNTMVGLVNGPLWGHPHNNVYSNLKPKSPEYPFKTPSGIELRRKRWCEEKEPQSQPVWKLLGTASVGGQTLVGIPVIHALRAYS